MSSFFPKHGFRGTLNNIFLRLSSREMQFELVSIILCFFSWCSAYSIFGSVFVSCCGMNIYRETERSPVLKYYQVVLRKEKIATLNVQKHTDCLCTYFFVMSEEFQQLLNFLRHL